jgi:hypothetical protein
MFETMQGFLAFFIPTLALIILGIIFEEKLIWLEDTIWRFIKAVVIGVRMTIRERKGVYGEM